MKLRTTVPRDPKRAGKKKPGKKETGVFLHVFRFIFQPSYIAMYLDCHEVKYSWRMTPVSLLPALLGLREGLMKANWG